MNTSVLLPQLTQLPLKMTWDPQNPLTPRALVQLVEQSLPCKPAINIGFEPVAALWQDQVVDLDAPLKLPSTSPDVAPQLLLIDPKSAQGLEVLRHSCAHLLAQAVKELFPEVQVTIGPVIEDGFYYDFYKTTPFHPEELAAIEQRMHALVDRQFKVQRHIWSRDQAIDFFHNRGELFKVEIIRDIPQGESLSVYQQGDFYDLCRGPHVPTTAQITHHFALTKISAAYWRGDSQATSLQRIYGTAWARAEDLAAYQVRLEEAQKRDHRKLAAQMDLFHFQEEAPGSIFWHGPGWTIYTTLQSYMRRRQRAEGYIEVNTPQMVSSSLWQASGHWQKYRDNMFVIADSPEGQGESAQPTGLPDTAPSQPPSAGTDGSSYPGAAPKILPTRQFALKPMNCPCHVQIFNHSLKSYRDLPLRMAEFGACMRNEASGARSGIMRVSSFVQDDAHIFCTPEQMIEETQRFCEFLFSVYKDLGFTEVLVRLSTRPKQRLGDEALWDQAEEALHQGAQAAGLSYTLSPGDGAFYGPKLEFTLKDSLGRLWQCGTLQVDFVLPQRLGALYTGADGTKHHVVMLHRAILGSFERFLGVLLEHTAGHLPAWLSPTQVVVAPITDQERPFAQEVVQALGDLRVHLDDRNEKLGFKVRDISLRKVPHLLVIGKKEVQDRTVTWRQRQGQETLNLDQAALQLTQACAMPTPVR